MSKSTTHRVCSQCINRMRNRVLTLHGLIILSMLWAWSQYVQYHTLDSSSCWLRSSQKFRLQALWVVIMYIPHCHQYFHFCNNCSIAEELSPLSLTNKLRPVTAWHQLGLQLEVPSDELERIEQNYPKVDRRMLEVFNYWCRNCPTERRSWKTIANALKLIGYRNLAAELDESVGKLLHVIIDGRSKPCSPPPPLQK